MQTKTIKPYILLYQASWRSVPSSNGYQFSIFQCLQNYWVAAFMFPISHFWEEFFQLFKKIFETLPFLLFVSSLGKEKIQEQREESFHVILRPVCVEVVFWIYSNRLEYVIVSIYSSLQVLDVDCKPSISLISCKVARLCICTAHTRSIEIPESWIMRPKNIHWY